LATAGVWETGSMTDAEWLRDQAERCLRFAQSADDPTLANSLKARAADYLESAQALERLAVSPSILPATRGQRPAQQQQQIQPKIDKTEAN
jgi:hypothetical protein